MAKNGRKRVEDYFDWRAIAKQTEAIYKSLIRQKMINDKVLSIILGGGQGSRLYPLTENTF